MHTKIRWWPAIVIACLWVLVIAWLFLAGERTGQEHTLGALNATVIAFALLLVWFLAFSRLPWRGRLAGAGGLVALGLLAAQTLEIRGVSGDLLPVVAFKWTPRPGAALLPGPAATVPAPAASTAPAPEPAPTPAAAPTHIETQPASPAAAPAPAGHAAPASAPVRGSALPGLADWPGLLGPRRNGVIQGVELARDWRVKSPRELWRIPVGAGWAGFAVVGERAYTLEQHGPDEVATAYELATGERLWSHADPTRYETTIGGIGPRSTPTLAGGRVYVMGATGHLRALDAATGELLWQRDTVADNGAEIPEWGRSVSPLVVQDLVVIGAGGPAGRSVVAYDAGTGEPRWAAGDDGPSYSSPVLLELAGEPQVVSFNAESLTGHALADGRQLWRFPWPAEQPNVSVPLALGSDQLFASSGYGVGAKRLRIAAADNGLQSAELIWQSPRLKAKFTNVVEHQGHLYGLDDGTLVCLDPATGERRWKAGRYGHGQVILAGALLLVQTEQGEIVLVEPSPEAHRELARHQVHEGKTWNPPALAGRYLLTRTDQEAALLELPVR